MHRWTEELRLTKYEMQWTVRYFVYQALVWRNRRELMNNLSGHRTYAEEQMTMWNELAHVTEASFQKVYPEHPHLFTLVE